MTKSAGYWHGYEQGRRRKNENPLWMVAYVAAIDEFRPAAENGWSIDIRTERALMNSIEKHDPDVWAAIASEIQRQRDGLEMIASENYTSPAVMQCMGSVLTNKYAEGYPGRRYYGGCEFVDVVEDLARNRAKKIFGADHANVQPHSGAQANAAVYFAVLNPGDVVLGLDLAHGGHLTHGMKLNSLGQALQVL